MRLRRRPVQLASKSVQSNDAQFEHGISRELTIVKSTKGDLEASGDAGYFDSINNARRNSKMVKFTFYRDNRASLLYLLFNYQKNIINVLKTNNFEIK